MVELTDANFDAEVLAADRPVLVEFWAPWCGPCVEMAPTIDALARDFAGRATVARVHVDDFPELSSRYDVDAPPVLILFDGGRPLRRRTGRQTVHDLRQVLEDGTADTRLKARL